MSLFRPFVIPWLTATFLIVGAQNQQNLNPLFDLIARQQQINHAILINNALLANSMNAAASQSMHNQAFGNLAPIPQFNNINNQQLGMGLGTIVTPDPLMYGKLSHPHFENYREQTPIKVLDGQISHPSQVQPATPQKVVENEKQPLPVKVSSSTSEESEEVKEIQQLPVVQEKHIDVHELLKRLNLTDEETASIINHVEEVVKEDLVKKLGKLQSPETPLTSTTSASTATETTTTTTTTEKPEKLEKPEIKLHPTKASEKGLATIVTSEKHLNADLTDEDGYNGELTPLASCIKCIKINKIQEASADEDLLITGPPLDLEGELGRTTTSPPKATSAYRHRQTSPTPMTSPLRPRPVTVTHAQTQFEKLASDYRQRLGNSADVDHILKTFYKDAYIQLSSNNNVARRRNNAHGKSHVKPRVNTRV